VLAGVTCRLLIALKVRPGFHALHVRHRAQHPCAHNVFGACRAACRVVLRVRFGTFACGGMGRELLSQIVVYHEGLASWRCKEYAATF
jgi:hypothetical protein